MGEFDDDDSTPPRKPRAHWDDDQRTAVGKAHRTSPFGVPMAAEDRGEVTPITDLLDLIPDPHLSRLFRITWLHAENMRLNLLERLRSTGGAELRKDLDQHQEDCLRFKVDLVGDSGDDGQLGAIRESIRQRKRAHDSLVKRLWWVVGFALSAVGAAVVYVAVISRSYGDLETEVKAQGARVQLLEQATFFRDHIFPSLNFGKEHSP